MVTASILPIFLLLQGSSVTSLLLSDNDVVSYLPFVRSRDDCVFLCLPRHHCYVAEYDVNDYNCRHYHSKSACSTSSVYGTGVLRYHMKLCTEVDRSGRSVQGPDPYIVSNYPQFGRPLIGGKSLETGLCGRPPIGPHGSRIVGGEETRRNSFPWQVALRNLNSRSSRCAGSLVASHWVLTTAHCVDQDTVASHWVVLSGAHDLLQLEPQRTAHRVDRVILHPHFDLTTFDNDVALLRLAHPVLWDEARNPACLPSPGYIVAPGTRCITAGWGSAAHGRRPLKQATVPIIDRAVCRRHDWLGSEFTITDRMLCAGYEAGGIDTCQGDSGGPLVCYLDQRWLLLGMTSFGRGCGLPKKPGVYTEVSKHIHWIRNTMAVN